MKHSLPTVFTTLACTMLFVILPVVMILPPSAEADSDTATILEDEYWDNYGFYIANSDEDDEFEISVEEINGMKIDVYILKESEYNKYKAGDSFVAEKEWEDIVNFSKEKWTCPTDLAYYLVVDNTDIGGRDDAYADSDVDVEIIWKNKTEEKEVEDFLKALGIGIMACCGILIIIIIVCVGGFYYFFIRDDRTKVVQPYYSPPPPPMSQPQQYQEQTHHQQAQQQPPPLPYPRTHESTDPTGQEDATFRDPFRPQD